MNNLLDTNDSGTSVRRLHTALGSALVLILAITSTGLADEPRHPVAVWPSGPLDVIAAFEKPVDPAAAQAMVGQTILYNEVDGARPYPDSESSGRLRIVGARLVDDGRTLVLATDPHPKPARYLLPLPGDHRTTVPYDLSGVEAVWNKGDLPADAPDWSGWWPSLETETARALTRDSKPHENGWAHLRQPGRLVLSGWLRLPKGRATVQVQSNEPIEEALFGDTEAAAQAPGIDETFRIKPVATTQGELLFFTMTVRTGTTSKPLAISATYRMEGDSNDRPIGRDRLILPWAPITNPTATAAPIALPNLSGGDPERGQTIFRGDQARCVQCHVFRGEGGKVGPDLTDIGKKGKAHIYRSLATPSAEIAPDYTTYAVATRDGQVYSGIVRAEGPDAIQITDTNARTTTVRRDKIQELRPSATSIMPPGMAAALGESAVRDLVAYLTSP